MDGSQWWVSFPFLLVFNSVKSVWLSRDAPRIHGLNCSYRLCCYQSASASQYREERRKNEDTESIRVLPSTCQRMNGQFELDTSVKRNHSVWLQWKQRLILKATASRNPVLLKGAIAPIFVCENCKVVWEMWTGIYWSCGTKLPRCSLCCAESRERVFAGVMTFCFRTRSFCRPEKEWAQSEGLPHPLYSMIHICIDLDPDTRILWKTNDEPFVPCCSCWCGFSIVFPDTEDHRLPHQGL